MTEPMTRPMTGQPLRTERFRVPMGDTDAAQIIYFGAPPRWAERLFTSYLADIGLPTSALLASGCGLPAVDLQVKYRRPLRLDDQVRGELHVHRRSARSITWQCDFFPDGQFPGNDPELAVQVLITQVSVRMTNGQPSPVPLPAELIFQLDRPPGDPR
jgi:acyl-CoA thioester hydrolase